MVWCGWCLTFIHLGSWPRHVETHIAEDRAAKEQRRAERRADVFGKDRQDWHFGVD